MALAVQTGIPPSVWADEGWRTIDTAYDIIEKQNRAAAGGTESAGPATGPQMSG